MGIDYILRDTLTGYLGEDCELLSSKIRIQPDVCAYSDLYIGKACSCHHSMHIMPHSNLLFRSLRLESAMVITVDPGAPAQNAHVDTQDEGSISVHIPLHSLHDGPSHKQ